MNQIFLIKLFILFHFYYSTEIIFAFAPIFFLIHSSDLITIDIYFLIYSALFAMVTFIVSMMFILFFPILTFILDINILY